MTRLTRLVAFPAAILLLLAACGAEEPGIEEAGVEETEAVEESDARWAGCFGGEDEVLRVAFVYVGPVGDAGWTFRHDIGRQEMEEALGDRVETTFLETVEEGAPAERVFEDLARQGHHLIFGTSFGYRDSMLAVAEKFPQVVFMHATGDKTAPNLGTYFHRDEQGQYLGGIAAGAATHSGQIGYVGAFPIPDALRRINAFTLGAQSVNPDATVQVTWISTWFDPPVETEAANSLMDIGVDVLGQDIDGPATGQAAEERGARWVGLNSDMGRFAPEAWLTATVWEWGDIYTRTAEEVWNCTWESGQHFGTFGDGGMTLAPLGESIDDETRALIEETRDAIIAEEFDPLSGPIRDQNGELRLAEGEIMSLEERLTMDYFVEGVIGSPTG